MTHSHVWHDSFIFVTWFIYICDMTRSHVWHDSFTCVTWLVHMFDMTHSHVWHDMTHSHVWHDLSTCVTWLIHMCDTTDATHSNQWTIDQLNYSRSTPAWNGLVLLVCHPKEPYNRSKEPYNRSKEPYIRSKEPYIRSKEPYILILAKDPYIWSTEPFDLSKEPFILSKEPCSRSKEPWIFVKRALQSIKRILIYFGRKSTCIFSINVHVIVSTEILPSRNPPNLETQIPPYKCKRNQNLNLNLYREIPRNLSFSIWGVLGM